MLIVGIDCASQPEKTGVAIGKYEAKIGKIEILQLFKGEKGKSISVKILTKLAEIAQKPTEIDVNKILVAVDAPLGWPVAMSQSLANHIAGASLGHNRTEKDRFFRRFTDTFIHQKIGKLPLEVGADRIARAAYSALQMMEDFRQKFPVEMLWDTNIQNLNGMGVIEVYPAATLKQHNLIYNNYKKESDIANRKEIIEYLQAYFSNITDYQALMQEDGDRLDAIVCLLCAKDFVDKEVMQIPVEENLAFIQQEGWIWVKGKNGNPDL
jgi:predicted nuclease with RNAse H fold